MRVASLYGPLSIDCEDLRLLPASREDRPPFYGKGAPHNMGDWFVTRSTVSMLDAEAIYSIGHNAPDKEFDRINAECDVMLLKGGNFLSGNWLSKNITYDLLKKIRIPIIYVGAGLQAPIGSTVTFTPEEITCLKYIHDSAASSGVRGESTKAALEAIGITNAKVIGCPTLFWSRKPTLAIRRPQLGKVAWTLRDGLFSSQQDMHRKQFDIMRVMRKRAKELTVFLQGEEVALQEYFMYRQWGRHQRITRETLSPTLMATRREALSEESLYNAARKAHGAHMDEEMLRWMLAHAFFSYDPAEYLDFLRAQDLVLGCRLHGNLVALSQGTPAFCLTYDERTREMMEWFKVPHANIADFNVSEQNFDMDYAPFEQAYAQGYQTLRGFFEENNIKHTLDTDAAAALSPAIAIITKPEACALVGKQGWFFLCGDSNDSIAQYTGALRLSEAQLAQYRALFAQRRAYFASLNIPYLFAVLPGKESIYPEFLPGGIVLAAQGTSLDQLSAQLEGLINLRPALQAAKNDGVLYYRNDSHWNYQGAFAAYRTLVEQIQKYFPGMTALTLADLTLHAATCIVGDLMDKTQVDYADGALIKRHENSPMPPEEIVQLTLKNPRAVRKKVPPSLQVSPTRETVIYEQHNSALPSAVIFRDSYADWMLPFLAEHFRRVVFLWQAAIHKEITAAEKPDIVLQLTIDRFLIQVPAQ